MNNFRIFKTLAIAVLSSMTLLAGTSQANGWGHYERAYAPYFPDRPGFDQRDFDHRGPDLSRSYSIDARQQRQLEQIMHGLRSGKLSRHEADGLILEQRRIERMQRHFLADRRLDRDEWLALDRRLDHAAEDIRAEKRDGNWR